MHDLELGIRDPRPTAIGRLLFVASAAVADVEGLLWAVLELQRSTRVPQLVGMWT